jgi:hypothetical protein
MTALGLSLRLAPRLARANAVEDGDEEEVDEPDCAGLPPADDAAEPAPVGCVGRGAPAVRVTSAGEGTDGDVETGGAPGGEGAGTAVDGGGGGAGTVVVGGRTRTVGGGGTGTAVVVGGGTGTVGAVTVGTVTVGTVTVGAVTVGTVTVGTGTVGTVVTVGTVTLTVGTGGTCALPDWTSTCAAAKPLTATTRPSNLTNHVMRRSAPIETSATTTHRPRGGVRLS